MDDVLVELCIHNLTVVKHHCSTLPEYQRPQAPPALSGEQRYFNVEPDGCARSVQVQILPSGQCADRGVVGHRQVLLHSLLAQRSHLYAAWWCDASTCASLACSLLDLADALDPSGAVTSWEPTAVMPVVRAFCEQQRIRTRCVVLILDNAAVDAVTWFIKSVCPAWGATVFVLPAGDVSCRGILTSVTTFVPSATVLPAIPLSFEQAGGWSGDRNEAQMMRASQHWVPHLASTVLGVDVLSIDDSYLRKYFTACGYSVTLLRLLVCVMKRSHKDSYEAYHAVVQDAELPRESVQAMHLGRIWDLLCGSCAKEEDTVVDDLLAVCALPSSFPSYVLQDPTIHLLEQCGVLTRFCQGHRSTASIAPWISTALRQTLSSEQQRRGCLRVLLRVQQLDANLSTSPVGDRRVYRLHDELCLGGQRVTVCGQRNAVHRDACEENPAATPEVSNISPRTARGVPFATCLPVHFAESWARHRSRVTQFTVGIVTQRRWFFPQFPNPPPQSPNPPIQRTLGELVFGIPPLPDDELSWSTTLAALYLKYADHFRASGDFLNAAAASERALCVYLHFLDVAATAATAKYAVRLSKGLTDDEQNGRRRSMQPTLTRRASSRRSADSTENGELRSVQSGMGSHSFVRKMSRLTQMTHESTQQNELQLGPESQQAYAHVFSFLWLGIETLYRGIARDYASANVSGIACPLLDRGVATLELLNMNRRDTPARAVTSFRRGEKELLLSRLEKRRGDVIQHAPEVEDDEGDLRLKALVKADVEERHHLRSAAEHMKECLQVLRINNCHALLADMIETCNEVVARHYLSEVSDKDAAESAERAVAISSSSREGVTEMWSIAPRFNHTAELVMWARCNIPLFLHAIASNDYVLANEMLDRSPYIACMGVVFPDDSQLRLSEPPLIVCAACGKLTKHILDVSFPEPLLATHLHLYTSFSDYDIASHHGNSWDKSPREYRLPLLEFLRSVSRTNEAHVADGNRFFRRLMEECTLNPLCSSPHDMKTALHIATERSLGDIAQYLLQHPLVDPLVASPFVLAAERVGLRTIPDIKKLPNPLPCPLLHTCELSDCAMLMTLLFGSKDPEFTFSAAQYTIVERVAREEDSAKLMHQLIGPGARFAHYAQPLLVSPKLCSETREAVGHQCPKETVLWGLSHVEDPHVLMGLCSIVARWGESGAATLLDFVVSRLGKQDWGIASEVMRRFPSCVPEDRIPFDLQRDLKRWAAS